MLILTSTLGDSARRRVRERFRAGELVKLGSGIYAPGKAYYEAKTWEKYRMRCIAAAVSRPAYVLVGKSAAAAWRVPYGAVPKYVEQARLQGSGGGVPGSVKLRDLMEIPGQKVYSMRAPYSGGKVTALGQTLIDVARWHGVVDGVVAMDHSLRQNMLRRSELRAVVEAIKHRRGKTRAAQALQLAHPAAESPRESMLRVRMWELGFPAPHVQVVIKDYRGDFIGRVDLFYPEYSLAVEYDGGGKYSGLFGLSPEDAMHDELRRQRNLLNAGVRMIRVDQESYGDSSWCDNLQREIELAKRTKTVFPDAQWSSAGAAW